MAICDAVFWKIDIHSIPDARAKDHMLSRRIRIYPWSVPRIFDKIVSNSKVLGYVADSSFFI